MTIKPMMSVEIADGLAAEGAQRDEVNVLRALAMDAVQKANSGHPGMPMGMAEIAEALWRRQLRHNPAHPNWCDRDRFVLSNGHGSMLQYALLHLTGYDLPIEELKRFRQLHSKTPGHPEYGVTPGIETTTGPLGQGLANAVGMAIAEKLLTAEFNRPGVDIVDHHTYVFLGDGCMMEGISHEACSLAGTLGLGKLIAFYDDNGISIDGRVEAWFTDDTPKRFESYRWHVLPDIDGHDSEALLRAIAAAEVVAPGESSFRSSVRHRDLGPLTILEFDVEPYQVRLAAKLGSAPQERLVLWLSIDGTGWVEQGGVTSNLDPSILCVYGADRPRTFAFTTPSRGVALLLPLDPVRQALQGWELALPLNIDCTRGVGAVLADVVRSVARHADDLGEDMAPGLSDILVGLLASVVSVLPASFRMMPSRLELFHKARIKRFVREHLRDPALDVDTVSQGVGLSTRYIHKLFSSEPERLMKWVWAERIEGACKEIEKTALRRKAISQIAFSWGFSGSAHFSRSFRKRYGVSPIEYRSRAGVRSKASSDVE